MKLRRAASVYCVAVGGHAPVVRPGGATVCSRCAKPLKAPPAGGTRSRTRFTDRLEGK